MRRDEAVEKLKASAPSLQALGATSLFLFGSTARDEATASSDVDLFIDIDPAAKFTLLDLVEAKQIVEGQLEATVDLATRRGLHPIMRADIEQEAIRIF